MKSAAPPVQADAHSGPAARAAEAPAPQALAAEWSRLSTQEQWLAYLRRLVAANRFEDARRSAGEMKRRWPDLALPDDLTRALTPAP